MIKDIITGMFYIFILICLVGFMVTYDVDNEEFNNGKCDKCGNRLKIFSKNKNGFWNYTCECSPHNIIVVLNPYLNWRYGRKLKKVEEK